MIVEQDGRYLAVKLPRGRVVFPGGYMTWREEPKQAAEREGYEETGFRLQADEFIHFYAGTSSSWLQMSTLSFVFYGHIVGGKLRKSAEGQPCWMTEEELRKRVDKYTLRVLDDYILYRKKKLDATTA
jgi:ADP-ribose pyrophosphatase YjhB (NUDIX family)